MVRRSRAINTFNNCASGMFNDDFNSEKGVVCLLAFDVGPNVWERNVSDEQIKCGSVAFVDGIFCFNFHLKYELVANLKETVC